MRFEFVAEFRTLPHWRPGIGSHIFTDPCEDYVVRRYYANWLWFEVSAVTQRVNHPE